MNMAKGRKKKTGRKNGTWLAVQARDNVSLRPEPWDMGANGPASAARASVIVSAIDPEVDAEMGELRDRNPNGVAHRRFIDMLDQYHRCGSISDRGFDAGRKLRDVWSQTQRGRGMDWTQDRVDASPKPDATVAVHVDRMSAYIRVKRMIPAHDDAILMAVVCEGYPIGRLLQYRAMGIDAGKAHLRDALDRLAVRLGC